VSPAPAVATAATFVWLGMVLAISFLEAPLRFRAPGVTVVIGLGIGRLVFRALNGAEAVLATVALAAVASAGAPTGVLAAAAVAVAVLAAQLAVVRPLLTRRSARILAGEDAPRSHAHVAYLLGETVKVLALVTTGVLLLAA
jgi:hypothetical protein